MHNLGQTEFGHLVAWGMIGGVAYIAWKYDEWRHENGWVDLNQSDAGYPVVPDPQAIVAENADKQQESEDDKP